MSRLSKPFKLKAGGLLGVLLLAPATFTVHAAGTASAPLPEQAKRSAAPQGAGETGPVKLIVAQSSADFINKSLGLDGPRKPAGQPPAAQPRTAPGAPPANAPAPPPAAKAPATPPAAPGAAKTAADKPASAGTPPSADTPPGAAPASGRAGTTAQAAPQISPPDNGGKVAVEAGLRKKCGLRAKAHKLENRQRAVVPEIQLPQDGILAGKYPLRQIVEAGRHLFTTPYTECDGYGEGPTGPRRRFLDNATKDPKSPFFVHGGGPFPSTGRFFRLNGLDSQNCFECHNAFGSTRQKDTASPALGRKLDVTGGAAGSASNAFINPALQCNTSADGKDDCALPGFLGSNDKTLWRNRAFMFLRNPPHVFGSAFTQRLAEEMTADLKLLRARAVVQAVEKGRGQVRLRTKDVDFGTYAVEYSGGRLQAVDLLALFWDSLATTSCRNEQQREHRGLPADFKEDCSAIDGVSHDLVVRPYQWKGIASDQRNFVRDAANFHFGIMPEELDRIPAANGKPAQENADRDRDGITRELTVGDVTSITAFALSLRAPELQFDEKDRPLINHGFRLFQGSERGGPGPGDKASCSSCHKPVLNVVDQCVTIRDPRDDEAREGRQQESARTGGNLEFLRVGKELGEIKGHIPSKMPVGLGTPQDAKGFLPSEAKLLRDLRRALAAKRVAGKESAEQGRTLQSLMELNAGDLRLRRCVSSTVKGDRFYAMPLSLQNASGQKLSIAASYPRPNAKGDGSTDLYIFTDFKRHQMGENLEDVAPQGVDKEGILVPKNRYMTRALWGVADTGPWMHDGRALTLEDAIQAHAGKGSEANVSVDRFKAMSDKDKAALIAFLQTLRLPASR